MNHNAKKPSQASIFAYDIMQLQCAFFSSFSIIINSIPNACEHTVNAMRISDENFHTKTIKKQDKLPVDKFFDRKGKCHENGKANRIRIVGGDLHSDHWNNGISANDHAGHLYRCPG